MADEFRPKFPLDPFAPARREYWSVELERLIANMGRDVYLILGAPTIRDLEPLIHTVQFSSTLLIIVTHDAPVIPPTAVPTIRILRLATPFSVEGAGAVRLVNILEWAERVARVWRKRGGVGYEELFEGECLMSKPEPRDSGAAIFRITNKSSSQLVSPPPPTRNRAVSHKLNRGSGINLPTPDPTQRAFDALINFLPRELPSKSLLKHVILITTISRPFLVAAAPPRPIRQSQPPSRSSFFRRPTSTLSLPMMGGKSRDSLAASVCEFPPPSPIDGHVLHLLPPQRPGSSISKLVHNMESFLISFHYPPSHQVIPKNHTQRICPYLTTINAFASFLPNSPGEDSEWTLAEAILCGALDPEIGPKKKEVLPRAWIPNTKKCRMPPSPASSLPPSPPRLVYRRDKPADSGYATQSDNTSSMTDSPPSSPTYPPRARKRSPSMSGSEDSTLGTPPTVPQKDLVLVNGRMEKVQEVPVIDLGKDHKRGWRFWRALGR